MKPVLALILVLAAAGMVYFLSSGNPASPSLPSPTPSTATTTVSPSPSSSQTYLYLVATDTSNPPTPTFGCNDTLVGVAIDNNSPPPASLSDTLNRLLSLKE